MKKSLAILQTMREKHNIASPQLKNRNLETKIEFLEFMVEHYNEIAECFLQISNKLETLSKDEIEVLRRYDIHYENYNSMKELIYEIEDVIVDLTDATDLEEVSINLSERDYYHNTNK